MNEIDIIEETILFVKKELQGAEGGHDWWHIERVWKNAKTIVKEEKANKFIIELGALLHDIADAKFHNGDENVGPLKAKGFLQDLSVDKDNINHVENIINNISFKGGFFSQLLFNRTRDCTGC